MHSRNPVYTLLQGAPSVHINAHDNREVQILLLNRN